MRWLALSLISVLVSGCVSTVVSRPDASQPLTCMPPFGCDVIEFVSTSEEVLSMKGGSILLNCPMHFYSPPASEIRPECVALVEAALVLTNHRFSKRLKPLKPTDVKYDAGGGCACTFIPGREQADCYTQISAEIELEWLTQVPKK